MKSSIVHNVPMLYEGGELKHYRLLNAQQYKLSASFDKSVSAPVLPMQCWAQLNFMNEVIIVANTGDNFNDLVKTAIEIVKVKTVSYALIEFNGCKVFIKKDSTEETAMEEYLNKLRSA